MSYKKMMIVLSTAMTIIILCLLGASYAYYSLSNASTEFNTTTADLDVSVIYEQSQYINTTTGIPLTDDEVATKASSSKFNALAPTASLAGYQVALQIDLVDIVIADELKISDFKIQLLENDTVISSLTGADIASNTSITLKSMSLITVGTTYNYELRVWLHETEENQNTLMNKKFSGRIEVSNAIKK